MPEAGVPTAEPEGPDAPVVPGVATGDAALVVGAEEGESEEPEELDAELTARLEPTSEP